MRSKDNPLVKHFFLEHTRELRIISLREKRGTVQRREKNPAQTRANMTRDYENETQHKAKETSRVG